MSGSWSGRKVRRLVNATLRTKGTICHLCLLPDANSADHDPPRSVLVAMGVLNPDQLRYLWPSHLQPCNLSRGAREVTPALVAELRTKRLAVLGQVETKAPPSPRFAPPPFFPTTHNPGSLRASIYLSGTPEKTGRDQ